MRVRSLLLTLSIHSICCVQGRDENNLEHANHMFNAIHSAMRQWGSSLKHNGMTAFIATVPADTEFYHGTSSRYKVNGTEWLAFEPEHAMLFARPRRGPPPGGDHGRNPPGPPSADDQRGLESVWRSALGLQKGESLDRQRSCRPGRPCRSTPQPATPDQFLVSSSRSSIDDRPSKEPNDDTHGYLHTYRTKHSLRLLYVDGQSAAKSSKGTLDLQDVVILDGQLQRLPGGPVPQAGGPMMESERAIALCARAKEAWEGRIDGILRMEGGFEIILCSFEQHLDLVSIKEAKQHESTMVSGDPSIDVVSTRSNDMINYYAAVAARYDGIGGHRVKLDFGHFVSLFAYSDAIFFDKEGLPRARNGSASLQDAREAIDSMTLSDDHGETDWQAIADMIVDRYSDRIEVLTSGSFKDVAEIREELELALLPFIDYSDRDSGREIQRCAAQFLPSSTGRHHASSTSLAGNVIKVVSMTICAELSRASRMHRLEDVHETLLQLRTWLDWTTWKRCRGCSAAQVCFLPIWPAGSSADFESPQCKSSEDWDDGRGDYWRE